MSYEEKITFYELLQKYSEEAKTEKIDLPETKKDYYINLMIDKHIAVIEEIREVLSFDF